MTTRFATPLFVAGLLVLAACGSSATAATTTAAGTAASSTASSSASASTGNTTGSSAAATTAANSTVPDSAATIDVKGVEGVAWDKKAYTATAKDGKVTINGSNISSIAHNLYVLDSAGTVIGDFINLPTKGSKDARVLPLAPGTYHIVCKVPGHSNMNSTLTVN
jgi:plastocyanin